MSCHTGELWARPILALIQCPYPVTLKCTKVGNGASRTLWFTSQYACNSILAARIGLHPVYNLTDEFLSILIFVVGAISCSGVECQAGYFGFLGKLQKLMRSSKLKKKVQNSFLKTLVSKYHYMSFCEFYSPRKLRMGWSSSISQHCKRSEDMWLSWGLRE